MKPPSRQGSPNDFQTPPEALSPLLKYIPKDKIIWECAEGMGWLTKAIKENGYKVIGTDILTGHNFLDWQPDNWDIIITNPPYSIKLQFLQRAYSLGKPFAFLLPLTTFETKKRQRLFKENGLEVIFLDRRINFRTPTDAESKSWFATAWFTNGLNIGNQMTWAKV